LGEAVCGEQSDRLLLVTYETLTSRPQEAIAAVYDFIGEAPFAHGFENVECDAAEFDRRMGTPGLHDVGRRGRFVERRSVLPPDLVAKFSGDTQIARMSLETQFEAIKFCAKAAAFSFFRSYLN
jgi:sulfotransferase